MTTLPGDPDSQPRGTEGWPDPVLGPWFVTVTWEVHHGIPVAVALNIDGRNPPHVSQVLEARLLRRMPIGKLIEQTRDQAAASYRGSLELFEDVFGVDHRPMPQHLRDEIQAWRGTAKALTTPRSARRGADLGDDVYRQVAAVYKAARAQGRSGGRRPAPTQAVADAFHIAHTTAAKRIQEARRRTDPTTGKPFLPPTTRGRAGLVNQETR